MHPRLTRNRFDADLNGLTSELCDLRGWSVLDKTWPFLDIVFRDKVHAPLRTRWQCDNWNDIPPSIELLEEDGRPLSRSVRSPAGIFHDGPHPITGLRFVCMPGSREYHMHDSHLDVDWDAFRRQQSLQLLDIVTMVWNGWSQSHI